MGSGLACNQTGKHIAYTAGTGILVFLDIVAYLLVRVTDKFYGTGIGTVDQKVTNTALGRDTSMTEDGKNTSNVDMNKRGPGIQGETFSQS